MGDMKNLFRVMIFLAIGFQFIACGQSVPVTVTASLTLPPSATQTPTISATISPTATATIEVAPRPTYVRPTLIPTIDSALLPELIKNAFSLQTFELNGYNAQRITGWNYGFGTNLWYNYCPGYVWLDTNHLLLYPRTGQQEKSIQMDWRVVDIISQPVVMNLETGSVWLPPVGISYWQACNNVFWSRDLGILVNSGIYKETPAVFTHTFDGKNLARYRGQFTDISPSKEKILLDNNLLIDLRTNSRTVLAWSLEDYQEQYFPENFFWTSDETRIYRCCYFYADLATGTSHRFERSDFQTVNADYLKEKELGFYRGQWVRDDTFFLVWWSYVDDGDIRYLPMFDPAEKILYDVRKMAGISNDWTCYQTIASPDGKHVWMAGADGSYLIDLFTFEAQFYPGQDYFYIDWSPNSNFVWIYTSYQNDESNKYKILYIADKEVRSLSIDPLPESEHLWHLTDNMVVYPAKDKNALIFLDAETMSFRELSFKDQDSRYKISNLAWSPNGDKLIFITDDHILWQVDYPSLENLEQIMASANTISGAEWSPDGNSIAFVNGSDIYIVDLAK